jgi:hypothetical protein
MATILRQRRDTAANWATNNPVIPEGQLCFDTTNNTFRVGDGTTTYSNLDITAFQSPPIAELDGGDAITVYSVADITIESGGAT